VRLEQERFNMTPQRILVVDDEPYVCDALKMMLTFDGHNVTTANLAAEALEIFDRQPFDLVITDYSMPVMKGDELAAIIKSRRPTQPIVMITAYAEMLEGNRTPLDCIDALVSKPFRVENLRAAIAKVLGANGAS
jgi:CheY-like chemotaxis protein